ncbi:MAG: thermonuclease family protein [Acidobacteriia bacterium]|nr:thermonuclease family protein [Terriglobia bacterium]
MTKGLLQVTGTIDVTQFWPGKESDADTVKVMVEHDGFKFSPDGKPASLKVTHVFDDAMVLGSSRELIPAVSKGKITVRLEHIDAPELHYMVPLKGTKNFRQYFGETATTKLHDLMASAGQQLVHCEVRTAIDHPNQAFDTYGRLIGSIFIRLHGKEVNINHWLVQNGWAFPAFYNLASKDEIKEVSKHAEQARKAKRGIWEHLSADVEHADFSLVFRHGGPPNPPADIGPLVMPKLFRREVLWHMSQVDGLFSGPFRDFLAKQKEDGWVKTIDFLQNPDIKPVSKNLSPLVNNQGMFELGPAELVFFEKDSVLVKAIDSWWAASATVKLIKGAA